MAVPKGKISKARKSKRKAHWKVATPSLVECPHCHELKQPHLVCKKCGYYDGEQRISVDKKKKEEKPAAK